MTMSFLYTVLWVAVPFVAALTVYGLLRNRERGAVASGCGALVAGVIVSFLITAIFLVLAVT